MVDKSVFPPTGLTTPLDPVDPFFNSSMLPFSSSEDPDAPPCVVTPARAFSLAPALCSVLASSWFCPVENSCEDAHHGATSSQAPHSRRLPRLSSRLPCLVGWRACAWACASLARGQKPAKSTQTHRHARFRLSQSAVRVQRDHRCAHPCAGWGWQARSG